MVKEYQRYSFFDFRNGNEEVLANVGDSMLMRDVFNQAIAFNKGFYRMNRFNFAIYAGTFNPFHIGHKSVLMKAYPLFDKIVIATPKVTGRVSLSPQEVLGRRFEVVEFEGLFPDFVNRYIQIYPNVKFTIIRGIRHSLDLQYEQDLQKYYKELGLPANVDIVYMSADPKVAHISGTAVRDIMKVNPDKAKQYIPDPL
jgi:pantetheine-phosphate adenylyltransferase